MNARAVYLILNTVCLRTYMFNWSSHPILPTFHLQESQEN